MRQNKPSRQQFRGVVYYIALFFSMEAFVYMAHRCIEHAGLREFKCWNEVSLEIFAYSPAAIITVSLV